MREPASSNHATQRRQFLTFAMSATALTGFQSLPKAWAAPSRRYRPVGLSLNVGLNTLDRGFYGDAPQLQGCCRDALEMSKIADKQGFEEPKVLFDEEASYNRVRHSIRSATELLEDGDFFLLTLATHGMQIVDDSGSTADGFHKAWCLYDDVLVDKELYSLLREFAPGVRVVVVIDSCHVGTAAKAMDLYHEMNSDTVKLPNTSQAKEVVLGQLRSHAIQARGFSPPLVRGGQVGDNFTPIRALPTRIAERVSEKYRDRYTEEGRPGRGSRFDWPAALAIQACQNQEIALDGDDHGLFTWALLEARKTNEFKDYRDLLNLTSAELQKTGVPQRPSLYTLGDPEYTDELKRELPLVI